MAVKFPPVNRGIAWLGVIVFGAGAAASIAGLSNPDAGFGVSLSARLTVASCDRDQPEATATVGPRGPSL